MAKTFAVLRKIQWCEDQLKLAHRYLETNDGADLRIFRPLFDKKLDSNGNIAPPHKDWVKNVFIRRRERAIVRLQKRLIRLEAMEHERQVNRRQRKQTLPPG